MGKAKLVLVCLVWLILLTAGVVTYRMIYVPAVAEKEREEEEQVLDQTSGSSNYKHTISFGLDGFSGYAVLRSDEMKQQLRSRGIRLKLADDGANYEQRLAALESGKLQMAAFPIDALLKSMARKNSMPATIVGIIDETKGADALVAYKNKYPNLDALNAPETRFVLVGDSPSETLIRFLMHKIKTDSLSNDSFDYVGSEDEIVKRYKAASPSGNEVFVTWEPVVSELLANDQMSVLFSSKDESGYIVDAIVVSRDYLIKNEPVVREVMESYFSALFKISRGQQLDELIAKDAGLDAERASSLVEGILWKNTQENFAHFGIRSAAVAHIEDIIDRIKKVLMDTGGLQSDPTNGETSRLFYEQVLASMRADGFHPGQGQGGTEEVREQQQLSPLSERQWGELVPVGTVDVPPLIYARGTARLTESSRVKLDTLAETLESFPNFYLMIRGNASSKGNAEANQKLAKQRADAALQYLVESGVPDAKLRATGGQITDQTSVTFVLGERPY